MVLVMLWWAVQAPAPKILTRYSNRIAGFSLPNIRCTNPAVEARWKRSAGKFKRDGALDHVVERSEVSG